MDLSKLPRLSETDKHAPPPQPPSQEQQEPIPQATLAAPVRAAAPVSAEVWFSIAIGLIIQLLNSRFWSFVSSKLLGGEYTWTFSNADGSPITYTQSVFFQGDLAMVLFGLVLMLESLVLIFPHRRKIIMFVFALTCITTAMNLLYLINMMNGGYGLQIMPALAVLFGGYIAMYHWSMLKALRT